MERHAGFYALFTVAAVIALVVMRSIDDDGNFTVGRDYRAEAPAVAVAPDGQRTLQIKADPSGSFITEATVNGADVAVLVDTGASFFTLRQSDAERAGIRVFESDFQNRFSTANGTVLAARSEANVVDFGPGRLEDVTIFVLPDDKLEVNLLGMNVLRRFGGVSFDRDGLTISIE